MSSNGSIHHSALPWRYIEGDDAHGNLIIVADEGHQYVIGNMEGSCPICHANAEMIVKAVNCHGYLATAVGQVLADIDASEYLAREMRQTTWELLIAAHEMTGAGHAPAPPEAQLLHELDEWVKRTDAYQYCHVEIYADGSGCVKDNLRNIVPLEFEKSPDGTLDHIIDALRAAGVVGEGGEGT